MMKTFLVKAEHQAHLLKVGIQKELVSITCHEREYEEAIKAWRKSLPKATHEEIHLRALATIAWTQQVTKKEFDSHKFAAKVMAVCAVLIVLILLASTAHCQSTVRVAGGSLTITDANGNAIVVTGGNLGVTCANCGGASAFLDKGAFTEGTTSISLIAGEYTTSPVALGTGLGAAFRITAWRAVHTNLRDSAGNELLGQKTMANSIPFTLASDQSAVPVSGTFWQGTQPVSGTFWQVTQPVSIAAAVSITPPTLTKGTQGATGESVQELKDAGRQVVTLTADAVTPAASDTILTVAKLVGDTVTAGVTTYAVTSGKTLRLQSLALQFTSSTTTANKVRVRLRTLSSGACIATSPLVGTYELALPVGTLAANQGQGTLVVPLPDGLEFSGATRNICLSAIAVAANGTLTATLVGYEY